MPGPVTRTQTSLPWPALSPRGGSGVPEVRSPQLSKAGVAQLPGISAKSWAAPCRDHALSASQMLSHGPLTPSPSPHQPPLTCPDFLLRQKLGLCLCAWQATGQRNPQRRAPQKPPRSPEVHHGAEERDREGFPAHGSTQDGLGLELPCLEATQALPSRWFLSLERQRQESQTEPPQLGILSPSFLQQCTHGAPGYQEPHYLPHS